MHPCVTPDFLDKPFQDYFALSCEVAAKTGTPLFSSGIFWTGTVSPQPPALSLARPCLCQIPLEPSSAHLPKENKTQCQQLFQIVTTAGQHRWKASSLSAPQTQPWQWGAYSEKNAGRWFRQTHLTTPTPPSKQQSLWQPVGSHQASAWHLSKSSPAQGANHEGQMDPPVPLSRQKLHLHVNSKIKAP